MVILITHHGHGFGLWIFGQHALPILAEKPMRTVEKQLAVRKGKIIASWMPVLCTKILVKWASSRRMKKENMKNTRAMDGSYPSTPSENYPLFEN